MNPKDYKNIAGIVKEHYKGIIFGYRLRTLSNKLADYFEREEEEMLGKWKYRFKDSMFNKKQFLKDTGIK